DGLIAQFDFADIADATAHPFRLQCEQSKLTRILLERLRGEANFEIAFSSAVNGVAQTADGVDVTVTRNARAETESGRYLIGADGARSETRGAQITRAFRLGAAVARDRHIDAVGGLRDAVDS